MKKIVCLVGLMILFSFGLTSVQAQNYDRLWKEVEELQEKDLPRSVIDAVDRIYALARKEENRPQMMKAWLVRAEYRVALSRDSLQAERDSLKIWAETETDTVTRAVLYSLLGNKVQNVFQDDVDEAISYFRKSLHDVEVLGRTSAKDYRPMTESGQLSETFQLDNMFDLLTRRAVRSLADEWTWTNAGRNSDIQREILALYDRLIAFYEKENSNRSGVLLTRLARLMYQQERLTGLYGVSLQEIQKQLKAWTEEYKGLEACADVYVKLADSYGQQGDRVRQLETAREGLRLYPRSQAAENLQCQIDEVLAPSLYARLPFVYPNQDVDLTVCYRNLKKVTFELYRLKLSPASPVLNGNLKEKLLVNQYGRKVASRTYVLQATPDYKEKTDTLRFHTPGPGIYMLKQIPEGKLEPDYTLLYVSPYACLLTPVSGKTLELTAVDQLSGHPVPEAEIVIYRSKEGVYEEMTAYRTGSDGRVLIPDTLGSGFFCNVRTPGNDYMPISLSRSVLYFPEKKQGEMKRQATLFTDRSLYRPGQTVQVSGILYGQTGDSVRVLKGEECEVILSDSHTRKVSEAVVRTDEFGTFSAEFVLPQQVLPGNFSVSVKGLSARYIRVEEYKRPTFDVVFEPYTASYRMGDTLTVKGTAKTFAGAPVRLAKVRYQLTCSRAWLWRASSGELDLMSGEVETSADGTFSLQICLKRPVMDNQNIERPYYIYKVSAAVTDGAGETQVGELALPVGEQSVGLLVKGLTERVAREKREKIQFQALNLNHQPVQLEVTYQIFTLNEEKETGTLVCEGKQEAQHSFVPEDLLALPSGRYRMKISATDSQGRPCSAEQDFILFSLSDVRLPVETTDWFYEDTSGWEEGKEAALYIGSSDSDVRLFVNVYSSEKRIETQCIPLNREIRKFTYSWKPEYGDGLQVVFTFLRKGQLYTHQVALLRPRPEKKLQLKWETFRDRLVPGGQEEWSLSVADAEGNPVRAAFLASMYDASLDKLFAHNWAFSLSFNRILPGTWPAMAGIRHQAYLHSSLPVKYPGRGFNLLGEEEYSRLYRSSLFGQSYLYPTRMYKAQAAPVLASVEESARNAASGSVSDVVFEEELISMDQAALSTDATFGEGTAQTAGTALRNNFSETAFFYPYLRTDSLGKVSFSFVSPEALTEWRFQGFAHTQEMDYGQISSSARTSKDFMVQPNLPRFLRMGDEAKIPVSLVNLSMEDVSGTLTLRMYDPVTDRLVFFSTQKFSVKEGQSSAASFTYHVNDRYDVLVCKITADAGKFSDGEQHYLPVLTDKQWITETLSLQLNGKEGVTVKTENLFNGQSRTASGKRLTVELTANPDWYAVQALPVVGNPLTDDAVAWATAYYANRLAGVLVEANPAISRVFESWKKSGKDQETLMSNLEKNSDLKDLLLAETPWVAEAADEAEQKRRIALLFDLNGMSSRLQQAADKLRTLQLTDGSWSWYKGMKGSRYITTQTVELMARLKAMNISLTDGMEAQYGRALGYLRKEVKKVYEQMRIQERENNIQVRPDEQIVKYLYICALDETARKQADKEINTYFLARLTNRSAECSIYEKSLLAVIMHAYGQKRQAELLLQSVKEYMLATPEMGRYFDTSKAGYSWNSYKIPTQVAAMEAIWRIAPDQHLLGDMKQWLLKQKQVQVWDSPLATADAVYAFLGMGGNRLQASGSLKARIGSKTLVTPDDALGYVRQTYTGADTEVSRIAVVKSGEGLSWGAVYAQYLEDMIRVRPFRTNGLGIVREYWLGDEQVSASTRLKPGDKLTVRLTVKADRDMDFVQIKDERASCMEPAVQLSGYHWNGGIGYYQVNKDASTEFFIDQMRKGTYVLEYTVYLDRPGTYQAGIATIQSAYAPELNGHTDGVELTIE